MPRKGMKPNKSMLSRFKVTRTGKLKRHHAKTSHLLSARTSAKKRHLGRPAIVSETHAPNLRRAMGMGHKNPKRTRHMRELAMKAKAKAAGAASGQPQA